MFTALVLIACRVLLIFLLALFIIIPLFKSLFKICYKQLKKEKEDIKNFIEGEKDE